MLAVVEVTMTWDVSIYLILMLSIEFGTFGFSNLISLGVAFWLDVLAPKQWRLKLM